MKSRTLMVAFAGFFIGLAPIPLNAQAGGVEAKVPFKFVVSGKTFAAGNYTMIPSSHQVKIEDSNGRIVAMILANNVSGRSAGENGQIIFHCYRDRCFLAEVWSPAQENGRQLLTPRVETELRKEEPGQYFAVLGEKPPKRQ
jgi:hypothetical protein